MCVPDVVVPESMYFIAAERLRCFAFLPLLDKFSRKVERHETWEKREGYDM